MVYIVLTRRDLITFYNIYKYLVDIELFNY